jgi:hypothetical protein
MAMDELIAYVVLLSLPLWLLIEQLLFLRLSRGRMTRGQESRRPAPQPGPAPGRPAPAAFRAPVRSSQR